MMLIKDKVMLVSVMLATALHAGVIFGISFQSLATPASMMQEVADVLSRDETLNRQADFIAQSNQQGGGETELKERLQSASRSPANDEQISTTLDVQNSRKQQSVQEYMQSYLQTQLSIQKISSAEQNTVKTKQTNDAEDDEERIMAQIATLEAQFSRRHQAYTKKTRIKTVNSMSSVKDLNAGYIERFRQRVEQIGNAHYPALARSNNLTGDVRLMVIISPKGDVKAIRMLQSSGHELLDEYAKATVRQAAPFGDFDRQMSEVSELRIIRTWRFSDTVLVNTSG